MSVAVIGVSGQLGRALSKVFDYLKVEFININRNSWDMNSNPSHGYQILLDLQPDLVINTAAYTSVNEADEHLENAFNVNGESVKFISKACTKLDVPLIQISTDYVFDGQKNAPYAETDATNPLSTYGKSKLLGEQYASLCRRFIILRTSSVFSAIGDNFVNKICRNLGVKDRIRVVDDQYIGPTSATSLAEVIFEIVNSKKIYESHYTGVYHYAGSPYVSWYEFALFIQKEISESKTVIEPCASSEYESKVPRPLNSRLSYEKIITAFKVLPCDWRAAIKSEYKN